MSKKTNTLIKLKTQMQKNLFLEVFLFFLVAICIVLFQQNSKIKNANKTICQLMEDNFIESLSEADIQECLSFSQQKFYWWYGDFIKEINLWLRSFNISHLYLYNSYENKKMWEGIGYESGLVAKNIFGKWIVTEVHNPDVDVLVGDEILRINNEEVLSLDDIQKRGGKYIIVRGEEKKVVKVKLRQINYKEDIWAKAINKDWVYIKIPTFKSDYFVNENLVKKMQEKQGRGSVIIDLRGNLGGNFVSILRVLSELICEEKRVGKIYNYRSSASSNYDLENNLNDLVQIQSVTQYNPLYLKTFPAVSECQPVSEVVALINEKTASVAELLVSLLSQNIKNFRSYGTTTAGHMLLAIWYPIESLGEEIYISIPYAWSTGLDEQVLEGKGVAPTQKLSSKDLLIYQDSHDPLLDFVLNEINSDVKAKELQNLVKNL